MEHYIYRLSSYLSTYNKGLCVVTTRKELTNINKYTPKIIVHHLGRLPLDTGVELLKHKGIIGSQNELEYVIKEYDGHALSLNLIGNYLKIFCQGDIRKIRSLSSFGDSECKQQAVKAMRAYEQWLNGKLELYILYLFSLFTRPVNFIIFKNLLVTSVTKYLPVNLEVFTNHDWKKVTYHLQDLGLLSVFINNYTLESAYDCHPLVRQYFNHQLRTNYPEVWNEGNNKLYEYFLSLVSSRSQKTMQT